MKKILILLVLTITFIHSFAQANLDSVATQVVKQGQSIEALSKNVSTMKTGLDTVKTYINSQKENATNSNKACGICKIDPIAFITIALTWIIILCLTCFFIYQYMKTGQAPELGGLSSVCWLWVLAWCRMHLIK